MGQLLNVLIAAIGLDPISLAIFFNGLVTLGVIWLAAQIVRDRRGRR